ncbi:MAG: epimerase [Methylocystis sp.]|nr:MAG: epimerase [Methylocystis sp.]
MVGATGTIGRETLRALVKRGHDVVCFIRPGTDSRRSLLLESRKTLGDGASVRFVDVSKPASLLRDGFQGERFDAIISCMASRTGTPKDAWAIDHQAHLHLLSMAQEAGVSHFVQLSAICVQKPILEFQHAKLAFERTLMASGMKYSIVRPTAFFKSLSGQIERVKRGKPFLVFGDGTLTSCKPISDNDLAVYLVDCLEDELRWNRVLPIGGPGDAITPKQQGEFLFGLLRRPPLFRKVPLAMLDGVVGVLSMFARVAPPLAEKAELARIGRYYATESMLLLNPATGSYDAAATPSTGAETIFDYYRSVMAGERAPERGEHAVF